MCATGVLRAPLPHTLARTRLTRNLVDLASGHMLSSKIKPCMSRNEGTHTPNLRTAHYNSHNLLGDLDRKVCRRITVPTAELTRAQGSREGAHLLDPLTPSAPQGARR